MNIDYSFVFLSDFLEEISQKQNGVFGETRPDDSIRQ